MWSIDSMLHYIKVFSSAIRLAGHPTYIWYANIGSFWGVLEWNKTFNRLLKPHFDTFQGLSQDGESLTVSKSRKGTKIIVSTLRVFTWLHKNLNVQTTDLGDKFQIKWRVIRVEAILLPNFAQDNYSRWDYFSFGCAVNRKMPLLYIDRS